MASQADQLRKIGVEGFALIDKYYGPQGRNKAVEPASLMNRKDPTRGIEVAVNYTNKAKFHHQPGWGGNRFHK